MNRVLPALVVLALLGSVAPRVDAQLLPGVSLSVEVFPGLATAVGDFAQRDPGLGAGAGPGVTAGATVGIGSLFALYGDYSYVRLQCDECAEVEFNDQVADLGWEAGAQFGLPLRLMGLQPWVRAGVVGHQLQISDDERSRVSDTAIGLGLGGGVYVPVFGALSVVPAIRYRTYAADFEFQEFPIDGGQDASRGTDVSYLMFDLGLSFRF